MSNVTTGDLAKIIAFDAPQEEIDVGKVVAVGAAYVEETWREPHWWCTSLSGPLMFEWYDEERPTGNWDKDTTILIPDRILKRIPPDELGDAEAASRPIFEFDKEAMPEQITVGRA